MMFFLRVLGAIEFLVLIFVMFTERYQLFYLAFFVSLAVLIITIELGRRNAPPFDDKKRLAWATWIAAAFTTILLILSVSSVAVTPYWWTLVLAFAACLVLAIRYRAELWP